MPVVYPTSSDAMTRLAVRFWTKVSISEDPNACWLWTAAISHGGYGSIGLGGASAGVARTHRVAYFLANGPIPPHMHVLHKCDTPACVNPAHLFLGTAFDNAQDKVRKGRNYTGVRPKGEGHWKCKLTDEQRDTIRSLFIRDSPRKSNIKNLARQFNVSVNTIQRIVLHHKNEEEFHLVPPIA
jgi:hypothetical protein